MSRTPLNFASIGQESEIISCNVDLKLRKHLETLGILPGEKITLLNARSGNLIVRVRDSRLALNQGLASKILVNG